MVRWDPKQCRLSPGTLIQALVINVLTAKQPLYRIEEFYKNQDTELLFGPGVTADALNDDALGRALNKLAQAHPKRVYLQLALSAVKVHGIDVNSVHADTTSKSVYGQYEDDDNLLKITHGYSKDHRPDLKQFLYGLIVNHEGIPLCGELRDGNTSDKTWNHDVLEELESLLPVAKGKCIYVADSALVTKANLDLMAEKDIAFISRLPDTFGIGKELKEWAFQENNWQNVGQLSPGSDKASYRINHDLSPGIVQNMGQFSTLVHGTSRNGNPAHRHYRIVADYELRTVLQTKVYPVTFIDPQFLKSASGFPDQIFELFPRKLSAVENHKGLVPKPECIVIQVPYQRFAAIFKGVLPEIRPLRLPDSLHRLD
jgi:hypothetical protein